MFVLRLRDANYLKKSSRPSAKSPIWTVDCDLEPCPTISASGIRGCFISGHHIEHDGEPPVKRDTRSDLPLGPEKPPYRVPLMSEIAAEPWNGFTVVSTFAGAGGSSTGYRIAGYRVLLANEFVPIAQESYRANAAPYTIVDGRDIKHVTAKDVLEKIGLKRGELDVFDGSPPCQAFSTAGKREKGWGEDKHYEHGATQKNEELFWDYIRLLRGMQPRVFVAENVTGLVKGAAKGMFLDILRDLKASGYEVQVQKLDAQWLGVPQCRERIIFVGVRNDLAAKGFSPAFPAPLPYRYSVRDALPHLGGGVMSNGHSFSDKPPELVDARVVHDTRGSFQSGGTITDRPSVTIMASQHDIGHFQVHGAEQMLVDAATVTHDDGRPGNRAKEILGQPAPTIVGSEGKQSNHFHVRQNSNATHSRKGESRSGDEPAPTLLARRSNLEVEVVRSAKLVTNSQFEEKLDGIDRPSPTIMAGGPGKSSGQIVEEIVGVGNNGGFGKGGMRSPNLPSTTIGASPSSGNGRFPPSLVEVRKIANGDTVPDNVAATLEGYAVGEEWDRLSPGQQSDRFFSLVKTDPDLPCPTVTASGTGGGGSGAPGGVASIVHPTEKRKFTIAEVRRLCAFPDDFVLKGTYGQQWERLGNSVPPVMMSHLAAAIRDKILVPAREAGLLGANKGSPRKGGGKGKPGPAPPKATGRPGKRPASRRLSTPRRPKERAGGPAVEPG